MPTKSNAQFHVNETARVASEAHAAMMLAGRGAISLELYLWYTPMKLWAAEEKPAENAQLAFAERLPGHLTADQLCAWLASRTARIPYLTEE